MNFVCDRCKQKYHVADEKLRGRAVTRFRCKKCENVIELDLAAIAHTTPSAEPEPDAVPTVTAPTVAKPAPKPVTTAPLSRPRSPTMVGNASASPAASGIAKPPVRARAATVTGTALGGSLGARATATAAKPAPSAEPARERTTSAILNASENGWYAGIRDLPVGPLTRKELLAKVQSGDVTADTLVWREGLDDWRPLRNVAELGDMLRTGAQKLSGSLLDEMGKRPAAPPARGAQVVPIGSARSASARPSVAEDEDEATRVTGLDPSIMAMAAKALAKEQEPADDAEGEDATLVNERRAAAAAPIAPKPSKPAPAAPHAPVARAEKPAEKHSEPAPPAPSVTPSTRPAPAAASLLEDLPEDLFAKSPKPDPAAIAPPSATTVNLGAQPAPTAQPAPLLAPVVTPAVAPAPAPLSIPVPAQTTQGGRPGGLSVGVIVLIGGVLVAGVGLGIFIGRKNNAPERSPEVARVATPAVPSPANFAAPTPAVPAPTVGEPVVAEPPQPEAAPQPEAVNPAQTAPATTAPAETADRGSRGHSPRERTPSAAASRPALSAQEQAMLRELGGPAATSSGGGPVGNTQLRASPNPTAAAAANNSGESDTARFNRAVRTFQSSRVADNCWQQVLRQNPALRSGAVQISFTVTNVGRFTSFDVANSPDPRFTQCIRSRGGSLAPLGGGSQINGQVSVNLTAN